MRANYLYYTLIIFTAGALCLQRIFKIAGGIGWGVAIAMSIYFLCQQYKNGELQKLLQKENLYTKHLKLLGLLAVVMLWGVLFTDDIGASFKEYADTWWYKTLPFVISSLVIRDTRYLRFILACFGAFLSMDCYFAAYQFLALGKIGCGFSGHHNYLGSIVAIIIPMLVVFLLDSSFSKRDKKFVAFVLLNCLIGSICSVSRGGWLTIAVTLPLAVLPYILNDKKKLLLVAGVVLCLGVVFANSAKLSEKVVSTSNTETNYSNITRFNFWNVSMYMIKDHPLGVGSGRWGDAFKRDYDNKYMTPRNVGMFGHPHNNYILVWVENGPLGILTYLYVCCMILVYNFKEWLSKRSPYFLMIGCGWLSFMVYGWFDAIVIHSAVTKIWWFLLGAMLTFEVNRNREVEVAENEHKN